MYRKDHVMIAKTIRQAGSQAALTDEQTHQIAELFAKEIDNGSPSFDRELFMAYALSPVLDA